MSNTNQQNMITQGTTLVGDIFSEGDFRIEGNIKGNIKTSGKIVVGKTGVINGSLCLLYTSPSPRDLVLSRMPSSA